MPLTEEIMIHPADLEKILQHLRLIKWDSGSIIIRDTGTKYIVRDKDEQHVCSIEHGAEDG